MALDKRKRKRVNAEVEKIRKQREEIRRGRIDGERANEGEMLQALVDLIQGGKEKFDVNANFTHRLATFDDQLIDSRAKAQKIKGVWKLLADTNKDEKLRAEVAKLAARGEADRELLIEKLQNGNIGALEQLALNGYFIRQTEHALERRNLRDG